MSVLPIECEIPSLKLKVELLPHTFAEEERFLYLYKLDETRRDAALVNEAHQKRIKNQYNKSVHPRTFAEGDLVLVYDQALDKLGTGKLEPLWHGPYILKCVLFIFWKFANLLTRRSNWGDSNSGIKWDKRIIT